MRRFPFREIIEERGIFFGERAVDLEAGVGPAANPVAVMKIGVAGVAVANEGFVMAAAGAERTRPAGVAIVLGVDIAAIEEGGLLCLVDAGGDVAEDVLVGIDEAVAGSDVAGRADAEQTECRRRRDAICSRPDGARRACR